jgi:hypothetical protein
MMLAGLLALGAQAASAQEPLPQQQAPNMPAPQQTIPEKVKPEEPSSTGSTLSDKLERSNGVIRPPGNVDPGINAPAPVPNPGTTPVIPPPGSPGGDPTVRPK